MKLSLSWVFDHINTELVAQDVDALLIALGKTTAEIDGVSPFTFDWKRFFVATVRTVMQDSVLLFIPELAKEVICPVRTDVMPGQQVLLAKQGSSYVWATYVDVGGDRTALLPIIFVAETDIMGLWRTKLDAQDWVIDIDNKSLTNRPDLWGHRGFAREIAAILRRSLVDDERLFPAYPVTHFDQRSTSVSIEASTICNRFATIAVRGVVNKPSSLAIVTRLARVGAKSISGVVDLTNYVMFDIGHPMHAFDADTVQGNLVVRTAQKGESLRLLDGSIISLSERDCVVADSQQVLSLAGIMGGAASGISDGTTNIILEAAHFDAAAIRISAQRAKVRTDSSMRFEKGLDPYANIIALERYVALLRREEFAGVSDSTIASIGKVFDEVHIELGHKLLVDRLGCTVFENDIVAILQRLGFGVQTIQKSDGSAVYMINVPLFRGYKDVRLPEDIIEEVARFIGYDSIPQIMPKRAMKPFDIHASMRKRAIRQLCAFGCGMHEVARYSLFDEQFLSEVGIVVPRAQELKNPLSQNMYRLVTSLVPHLLQAVQVNAILREEVRFFEMAKTWRFAENAPLESLPCEEEWLAGAIFARKNMDFYAAKQILTRLFDSCFVFPEWRAVDTYTCPVWFDPGATAELFIDGVSYGYFGAITSGILQRMVAGTSSLFAFELRTELFLAKKATNTFAPLSRYQATVFDVSVFAPYSVSVATIEDAIATLDARIKEVALIDVFEKAEWTEGRALTIRYMLQDDERTMTKGELDSVQERVVNCLKALGGVVR